MENERQQDPSFFEAISINGQKSVRFLLDCIANHFTQIDTPVMVPFFE